jgi:hypothetical protein
MGASRKGPGDEAALYAVLERLDRLEDLVEEMDELGVSTREEAERRIAELNDDVTRLGGE